MADVGRMMDKSEFKRWLLDNGFKIRDTWLYGEVVAYGYYSKRLDVQVNIYPGLRYIRISTPLTSLQFDNPSFMLCKGFTLVEGRNMSCCLPCIWNERREIKDEGSQGSLS